MGYYVSPRFLDKVAIHITKNFMELPQMRVPLILGVHGRKGEGKSFQCELVFKLMGIEPVRMSAGVPKTLARSLARSHHCSSPLTRLKRAVLL
jgi:hypothetical protein